MTKTPRPLSNVCLRPRFLNHTCAPLSAPGRSEIWSLPTPPPSLSELSVLACTTSPPPKTSQLGGGRSEHITNERSDQYLSIDQSLPNSLLPLSYTPSHRPNSGLRREAWPVPWFVSVTSFRRVPVQSFQSLAAGITRSRITGLGASVGIWLALYLACNLALTLHNKYLLNDFPFPWLLTALHAFCAALGSWICVWQAPLNHPTTPLLALFSVLYSANIAASNASLQLVSIATHQVVRAATPLFVIGFAWIDQFRFNTPKGELNRVTNMETPTKRRAGCLGITSEKMKSLTPVILDYSYTRAGLALTLLGTALAALKTMLASRVVQARIQTSYTPHGDTSTPVSPKSVYPARAHSRRASIKRVVDQNYAPVDGPSGSNHLPATTTAPAPALHPLDVLLRLSPLACIQCLVMAFLTGETHRWSSNMDLTVTRWRTLALNGVLAFLLNYVSFVTSRKAGPLTNVKQVLTILLALMVFNTSTPSVTHLVGIALTLGGGLWYGYLEVKEKSQAAAKELDEKALV
ncbi:TPT domain-containing protein [Rhizoctonia solani AG-1 IA]|uniref:GDP-mannose transporter n=1 Tax=Thanatephorus cucumeris (strain AG1-IA) TaxID=983506 RepID=L8WPF6_THACA|nr:TPT domain-containing protein [Rhizoctonia solani AG-1 IA]